MSEVTDLSKVLPPSICCETGTHNAGGFGTAKVGDVAPESDHKEVSHSGLGDCEAIPESKDVLYFVKPHPNLSIVYCNHFDCKAMKVDVAAVETGLPEGLNYCNTNKTPAN